VPTTPTYPGVYIEEIPSGVRTITGVATSITAFVGRTRRGPDNEPVTINSFADFERTFGGLWELSTVSYAVRDFYLNGGSQAIVVRLFHPTYAKDADRQKAFDDAKTQAQTAADAVVKAAKDKAAQQNPTPSPNDVATAAENAAGTAGNAGPSAKAAADTVAKAAKDKAAQQNPTPSPNDVATAAENAAGPAVTAAANAAAPVTRAQLDVGGLPLEAKYPGSWGNKLRARIDHDVTGNDAPNLFNLSVLEGETGDVEVFRNVSTKTEHKRRVDKVLEQESSLVRFRGQPPPSETRPGPSNPTNDKGIVPSGKNPFANQYSSGVSATASDGNDLTTSDYTGSATDKKGLYALDKVDLFNLLCIPPYTFEKDVQDTFWDDAAKYCADHRAMLIVDPPKSWASKDTAKGGIASLGTNNKNAAVFFPRLVQPNPLRDNQMETFVPCGAVAGIMARTDASRGVWKAPAGLDATLVGVPQLSVSLTDPENGELNPLGINCLRSLPAAGRVVWGSRTLEGDDRRASEWKYVPVRRLALYIEESLYRGTQWVVFEPNDEPLWAQIRLNIGAFMQNLFRQGAFQGKSPQEAYFVKADAESTTQNHINLGIVNIIVGFAPLKPAEFVIIKIQQMAGQIAV
jgi:uncharacterized protein